MAPHHHPPAPPPRVRGAPSSGARSPTSSEPLLPPRVTSPPLHQTRHLPAPTSPPARPRRPQRPRAQLSDPAATCHTPAPVTTSQEGKTGRRWPPDVPSPSRQSCVQGLVFEPPVHGQRNSLRARRQGARAASGTLKPWGVSPEHMLCQGSRHTAPLSQSEGRPDKARAQTHAETS